MANASVILARGGRVTGPVSAWPQWTVSRSNASRDEGLSFTFTITADNSTRLPKGLRFRIKRPDSVGGTLVTANSSDFDTTFAEAVVEAITAKNVSAGRTVLSVRRIYSENDVELIGYPAWDGVLVITRTSLNNPAVTGNLFTGIELSSVSEGTILVGAIGTTIVDAGSISDPPENTVAPTVSDTTPAVGSAVTGSEGSWVNSPTSFTYKWQRQVSGGASTVTFTDSLNRANNPLTNDTNWTLAAGSAANLAVQSNGLGTVGSAGTVALYAVAGASNHAVQFKALTSSGPRERPIIKWVDANNFMYLQVANGTLNGVSVGVHLRVVVGGEDNLRRTFSTSTRIFGERFYFEYVDGVVTFKRNDVIQGTPYTLTGAELTALGASTSRGIGTAASGGTPACDDIVITDFVANAPLAEDIPGATLPSFTPGSSEGNLPIRFWVLGRNIFGDAVSAAVSEWSEPVVPAPVVIAPVNISVPVLSTTTPELGVAVTCSTGTWDNNPTTFTYQWKNDGVNIVGATSASYTPVSGDVGDALSCTVTASNTGGSTSATSAASSDVTAPVTDATDATLGTLSYGPSVLIGAAADTEVGRILGIGGLINSVAVLANGDGFGRFKVVEDDTNDWRVYTTTVPADFTTPPVLLHNGRTCAIGHSSYTISLRINDAFDKQFKIRALVPKVEPTGDETATIVNNTTATADADSWSGSTGSRTQRTPYATIGVLKWPYTSSRVCRKNNFTSQGHWRSISRVGVPVFLKAGNNIIIKDRNFRCGTHVLAPERYDQGDAFSFGLCDANEPNPPHNILVENCTFGFSMDEAIQNISNGPHCFNIWFNYCSFGPALIDKRQPANLVHNYGPVLAYEYQRRIFITNCLFLGGPQRNPFLSKNQQTYLANCVMYGAPTNTSGHSIITIKGWNSYQATGQDVSLEIAANIIIPTSDVNQANAKSMAIGTGGLGVDNTINCNFGHATRGNHFARFVAGQTKPDFAPDPLSLSANVKFYQGGSLSTSGQSFINYSPFDLVDDLDFLESGTAVKNEAIWTRVMDYAGCRRRVGDAFDGAVIPGDLALPYIDWTYRQNARNSGGTGFYPSAATLAGFYGTEWDGVGGSTGHAMTDAPS